MGTMATTTACLAVFALLGCSGHTHHLATEESNGAIAVGAFQHEGPGGPSMVLEFEGKSFEARGFAISRKQDLVELKRQYGSSRHYDRIFSGLDTDHFVYSAEPQLSAANGATLRCSAIWRAGGLPVGHCVTMEGVHINLRFE